MKWVSSIAVLLFATGYWICGLFFKPGSVDWWDLRIAIFTLIFALCFTIAYLLTKGFVKAVFLVGIVFCAGDIVDRYLFSINEFHVNDILLFLFALIYLPREYARETKTNS